MPPYSDNFTIAVTPILSISAILVGHANFDLAARGVSDPGTHLHALVLAPRHSIIEIGVEAVVMLLLIGRPCHAIT
jgi:hypothetical protein